MPAFSLAKTRHFAKNPLATGHKGREMHHFAEGATTGHKNPEGSPRVVPDLLLQAVGTVPPSMTYSVPVIAPARGEITNAMRSATSRGLAGRPSGMPPSDFMMICLPP